jgi:MFS family permease
MMLITYLPSFLDSQNTESSIITLTMTIFMSTFFLFPSLIGKYSDKLQNRIYFIFFGTVGMLITIVFLTLCQNIIVINIELFILGFFISFTTVYLTLYSELVQNDKIWISYYNSACSIGHFIGVLIGGILIDIFRIEHLFFFTLIAFLFSIVFVVFIRENRHLIIDSSRELTENIHIEESNNSSKNDENIPHSIYFGLFFRSFGVIPIINILVIIMSFHISSNTEIGFLVGLNPLLQFFLMIIIGKLLNQKNIKFLLIFGYLISVFVIIGYIISFNFWTFFVFQLLLSLSYSLFWMATTVYIAQNSTPVNKGRYMGYATTSIFAGTTIGGLFFSMLLALFQSNYYISMSFMIMLPLISTLIIIFVFKLPK